MATQMILNSFATSVTAMVFVEARPAEELGVLTAIVCRLLLVTAGSITLVFHISKIKYYN